ncbi:MAG: hypothetical protein ACI86M_000243 [Saprospiraceae bacterium]|jgi:hypothetical protein
MLSNWLSPLTSDQCSNYFTDKFSCQGNFPDLTNTKVVVFSREHKFSAAVRSALGNFHNHFETTIVDIGSLNSPNASTIYQVISELQDGYILPVLIGVDLDCFKEFCQAMLMEGKLDNCAFISNSITLSNDKYNVANIGYQRHFIPKFQFQEIIESTTTGLSLGALRVNQTILEPILRECNYLHFDLASIRKSDCPKVQNSLPTGLHSEEACQIMRYVGEGLRLKLVTIDTVGLDENSIQEALLVSELIWYLHEGVELRSKDHPAYSKDFKEYIIELNEVDHSLIFTQSNKSGKWWLKLDNDSNKYVSCAYEEYQQTIENEIPNRLLKLL